MFETTKSQIPRLNFVAILSRDLERSVHFYSLIGLSFVKHRHGNGPEHYSSENASYVFEIYPAIGHQPENAVRVGFCIEGFDRVFDVLKKADISFVSNPKNSQWGRRMIVLDPDKNRVELIGP